MFRGALTALLCCGALVLPGCGGGGEKTNEQKAEERALSMFGEEGLVEAGVVLRAYEQGRLGTQQEVETDMEPYFNPPDREPPLNIPKPFDADGNIIPLGEMTEDQANSFGRWYGSSDKVNDIIGPEMQAAVIAFQEERKKK